jgi:WD40 repeat protein
LAMCGRDGLARLYNVDVAPPRKACNPRPSRSQTMVAISPDGLTAATAQEDFSIRIWNVLSGELGPACVGHRDHIWAMCFRADGKALLTASVDKTARIWDRVTGKPLSPPLHHPELVGAGALSSDGTIAATICRDRARFWEVNTGEERIGVLQGTGAYLVAFSPEGRTLAVSQNNTIVQLWDMQTKRLQHTFNVPRHITAFGFSPDGALLAAGDERGAIKLWNTQTGKVLHTLVGHRHRIGCVAISPDGKTLASGGEDHVVKLWDVRTGQEVASLHAHKHGVRCLAFTPDGEKLISAGIGEGREEIYIRSAAAAEDDSPGT